MSDYQLTYENPATGEKTFVNVKAKSMEDARAKAPATVKEGQFHLK